MSNILKQEPWRLSGGYRTGNDSILREDGDFLYVHTDDFVENVAFGGNCFLCGAFEADEGFTEEHIIPQWLLRHANIWKHTVELPNGRQIPYSRYKIRCCLRCNQYLSSELEDKVSQPIKAGHDALQAYVRDPQNRMRLFLWLCLIFLKMHLKDCEYRENVDLRLPDGTVGDNYALEAFHHIFCLVRSTLFDTTYSAGNQGSMIVRRIEGETPGDYDYIDHWATRTVYLRIKDFYIVASLADMGAVQEMMHDMLVSAGSVASYVQSREVFGDFMAARLHLNAEPRFRTISSEGLDKLFIKASAPKGFDWDPLNTRIRGMAQVFAFSGLHGTFRFGDLTPEESIEILARGDQSLFSNIDPKVPTGFTKAPTDRAGGKAFADRVLERSTRESGAIEATVRMIRGRARRTIRTSPPEAISSRISIQPAAFNSRRRAVVSCRSAETRVYPTSATARHPSNFIGSCTTVDERRRFLWSFRR